MILLLLSFVAGILTVLAPCTLPLLPVIVGSSIGGGVNKRKAFTIAGSLAVSIILFTFILKVSTAFITIPPLVWQVLSGSIIIIFGLISLFPTIWEKLPFVAKMNIGSNRILATGYKKQGIMGDIIIGASLGPVFSTCSPTYFVILATVLPQSFALGFIDLLAYAIGLSGMVLLIAFLGQRITARLGGLSDTHGWFKKVLGAIFIALGIIIIAGVDKKIEASLLTGGLFDITRVEQSLLSLNTSKSPQSSYSFDTDPANLTASSTQVCATSSLGHCERASSSASSLRVPTSHGPKAPEIVNPSGYINTNGQPITIGQFKGKKVVLLDIWTYSCINCQRTLPYVEAWYEKYKDQGLEVISLHTPEFAFEKVKANVEDGAKRLGVMYPVVMDNDYSTWNAYGNQYWPRKYLINANGEIIYDHIGEGNYDETEKAIQKALLELNQSKGSNVGVSSTIIHPTNAIALDESKVQSKETYFGAARNTYLANGTAGKYGVQTLTIPASIENNKLYLDGTWDFKGEYAVTQSAAKIKYMYNAKNVYFVGSSVTPLTITIFKDGVKEKTLTIQKNQLYTLIEGSDYGTHTLEIDVDAPGLEAFTLTFG